MKSPAAQDKARELVAAADQWFADQGWQPFPYQHEAWRAIMAGRSGLVNAPTGSGKTYSVWVGLVLASMATGRAAEPGLKVLWITPLRSLAADLRQAMQSFVDGLGLDWRVEVRSGDTTSSQRQRQKTHPPDCLITTPESLHLLISQHGAARYFQTTSALVADEWHELIGTKRGVQWELAAAYLRQLNADVLTWGISATIGNMDQAMQVLLGPSPPNPGLLLRASIHKELRIHTIIPQEIEKFPWSGHLGLHLWHRIVPIVEASQTTLLFTNTRGQAEIWYQTLMNHKPEWAGLVALHHGSLDLEVRQWVEDRLHTGKLKLVVCTSSLDLGVDFRPVETVIQVGGPKGVARFMQRAGRSGHRPGQPSTIYFLPTHSLELCEGAALKVAHQRGIVESRTPVRLCTDVLVQFLYTLAAGDGLAPEQAEAMVRSTHAFAQTTATEWAWTLRFVTEGGDALSEYDEFTKLGQVRGRYFMANKRMAQMHRMSIGTIVSEPGIKIKFRNGTTLGTVEEYFMSKLKVGQSFHFAGRSLKLDSLVGNTAYVKKASRSSRNIPSWQGSRMPLSSQLSQLIQQMLAEGEAGQSPWPEMVALAPLLQTQAKYSQVPRPDTLLIERLHSNEGQHLYFYTFQGRVIHEVLAALVAYRISHQAGGTYSLAYNDYGFELLSDSDMPLEEALELDLFTTDHLLEDLYEGINHSELAKRRFRDIAQISGLIFQGYPGQHTKQRHLLANSGLLYEVFEKYDPDNLLLKQSLEEVLQEQLAESRLRECLDALGRCRVVVQDIHKPTPFSFPIMVDRLRDRLTSEDLAERVARMHLELDES